MDTNQGIVILKQQLEEMIEKSAVNIRHITRCWVDKQIRPPVFQISSFTASNKKEVEKVRPS